jgi:hypothetical protein
MKMFDAFVKRHAEWLDGCYDCLDRIVLNVYFLPGQNGGGMRQWWFRLRGDPVQTLKKNSLLKMAGFLRSGCGAGARARACLSSMCLSKSASMSWQKSNSRRAGQRTRTFTASFACWLRVRRARCGGSAIIPTVSRISKS